MTLGWKKNSILTVKKSLVLLSYLYIEESSFAATNPLHLTG